MTQYYVYELIDPRNNLPFYVGKGNGDRMYTHKKQAFQKKGSKQNPHKSYKIKQIIESGNDIQYKKYECETEDMAFELEKTLISQYGKRVDDTGILTNITDGGEGYTGGHVPIKQYNLFGEYIKTHRSAKEAAISLGKNYYSQITSACRGGRSGETSAFGYLWSYIDKKPKLRIGIKPVYQWTLDGDYVGRFISISEAAKALEMDASNIPNAIERNSQTGGFVWSYKKQTFPGLCKNKKKRKIIHINTGIVYDTVTLAANSTGHNIGSICACCKGDRDNICGNKFRYEDSDQC